MDGTAVLTLEHAIVYVTREATLAPTPLCRIDERLIRTVSGLDQPATFSVIERLECGHELTIHPKADSLTAKYRRCEQCQVAALRPRVLPSGSGHPRGWWRNRPASTTPARLNESLESVLAESLESLDESARDGPAILDSAIFYLHREAQLARSENEHEDFCISLRMLALLRDGWPGGPGILDVAVTMPWEYPTPTTCTSAKHGQPTCSSN
jgi:hypothetical protein